MIFPVLYVGTLIIQRWRVNFDSSHPWASVLNKRNKKLNTNPVISNQANNSTYIHKQGQIQDFS